MSWAVLGLSLAVWLGAAGSAAATGPGGWDHLGTGTASNGAALDGRVDALISVPHRGSIPDSVFAGGVFTSAGGNSSAVAVARWDGEAWHSIGAPPISSATGAGVDAIAVDPVTGRIYVGGNFTNAGGNPNADFLAVWDGASWGSFCAPITANVKALQIIGRTLYIGGDFADGAGIPSADKLVRCNLDTGTPSSTVPDTLHEINGAVYSLAADSAGRLYAAGSFINIDGITNADHVAMFDGTWHAMQAGAVDSITRSIASDGTNVYIGSDSVNIAGLARADHLAKWNGTAWSALGANAANTDGWLPASAFINAIATSGSNVYVTGSFQNADGHPTADMVAGFNGFSWAPMGSDGAGNGPLGGPGNAITVFGGQVVAGGNFTSAGGDSRAAYVARYPGVADPVTDSPGQASQGGPFLGDGSTQPGAATPNVTVVALPVPRFSRVSMSNARFRVGPRATAVTAATARGTSFRFALNAPARVTIAITRSVPGVRRGTRCVAGSAKQRAHGKRCERAVKAGTLTRAHLQNGSNTIAFSGRIGKRALKPHTYKATLSASNAKGRSKPVAVRFVVVK